MADDLLLFEAVTPTPNECVDYSVSDMKLTRMYIWEAKSQNIKGQEDK